MNLQGKSLVACAPCTRNPCPHPPPVCYRGTTLKALGLTMYALAALITALLLFFMVLLHCCSGAW
jgi:hypothetical protein